MADAFKDDFLMTGNHQEDAFEFCNATPAEEQLAALADLVNNTGGETTARQSHDEPTAPNPPAQEYDLEAELERALNSGMEEVQETRVVADAPIPAAANPAPPSMEFADMIREEFDHAEQEQLATGPELDTPKDVAESGPIQSSPYAQSPISNTDNDAFAAELDRMLADQQDLREAELAAQFSPVMEEVSPIEPPQETQQAAFMPSPANVGDDEKDYSDPAAAFQTFFEPEQSGQDAPRFVLVPTAAQASQSISTMVTSLCAPCTEPH